MKKEKLRWIFTDAYILLVIFAVIIFAVLAVRSLLYPAKDEGGVMKIRTAEIDIRHKDALRMHDVIYDTVTKREIGRISGLYREIRPDAVVFYITVDAKSYPRGNMRTSNLWFEWEIADEENDGV